VAEGLDLDGRARERIDASVAELVAERTAVQELGIL
jgi:malate dehydrogenase